MATLYALQRTADSQWFTGFSDKGNAQWSADASAAMLHKTENLAARRAADMLEWKKPVTVRLQAINVPDETPVTPVSVPPIPATAAVPGASDPQAIVKGSANVIDVNETGTRPASALIPLAVAAAGLYFLMG